MIKDYIHYRSIGFPPLTALKLSLPMVSVAEKILCALVAIVCVMAIVFAIYIEYAARHEQIVLSAHLASYQRNMESAKVQKLEAVLVGCLNREPIAVNGRSMDCSIKEHKEAVDI